MDTLGQEALAELLPRISGFDSTPSEAFLLSSKWFVLRELFEHLREAPKSARAQLGKLSTLQVADGQKAAALRRCSYLRCRAAALLAGDDVFAPLVEHCDLSPSQREGKLAQVAVLDRAQLRGRNAGVFAALASDRDPVVAMAALPLLSRHEELRDPSSVLVTALGAESMGVVATAARVLAEHPKDVYLYRRPNAALSTALERALAKDWPPDAVELRVNLIDAVAELGILSAKAAVVAACAGPTPLVRQRAELALHRLGESNRRCADPIPHALPKELDEIAVLPQTLRLDTELGPLELHLDPTLAPIAVTRLTELAKAGFYDGVVVHRVVSGFVVQLGDRSPDGFGGAGQPTLPCELSPQPFGPLDVGMALSGPDSGSSQFFVTLGPYPQLGGEYTRIGRAGAGWERLFVGDRVDKVAVVPQSLGSTGTGSRISR
jgi:cyclophilin family peptidyl-prolyl cis-trans isomerase